MEKRFIETTKFPMDLVNKKSKGEKRIWGMPPFWSWVFWWTRKPLIGARAVIAASLLPENIDEKEFVDAIRLNEKTPHSSNANIPDRLTKYIEGKKVFDPFAGFGSIPLEGLRLGLDVTSSELLPTAYVFLKAVLEYPSRYGSELGQDVLKWGKWISEKLQNDNDISQLYEKKVGVYIGTWEVKCPSCGKWSPIVGNWWLARVKNSKGEYERLAFMDYEKKEDGIEIKITDVNEEISKSMKGKVSGILANAEVDARKGSIKVNKRFYEVPDKNISSRKEQAVCLNCGNPIRFVDSCGNHYIEKKNIPHEEKDDIDWFVKYALTKYNQGDKSLSRQRLLAKVKISNGELAFEPCGKRDTDMLATADELLKRYGENDDIDVPSELQPIYDDRHFLGTYGFNRWHNLFNSRQLIALKKIVQLIRKVGDLVEEEKKGEGWDEMKANHYAEGITTYLSIILMKFVDYNCLSSLWNAGSWSTNKVAHALSTRGITLQWNWCEINPFLNIPLTYRGLLKRAKKGIDYLTNCLSPDKAQTKFCQEDVRGEINAFIDDATTLSNVDNKFDIIVTDPPYSDDVPYTELSDFYYVWLKRALSEAKAGKLVPKFHPSAFFKKLDGKIVERETQWQEYAKREVSTNAGRFKDEGKKEKAEEHFENLLTQSFIAMKEHLKKEGFLVTYYAHTSPDAWGKLT